METIIYCCMHLLIHRYIHSFWTMAHGFKKLRVEEYRYILKHLLANRVWYVVDHILVFDEMKAQRIKKNATKEKKKAWVLAKRFLSLQSLHFNLMEYQSLRNKREAPAKKLYIPSWLQRLRKKKKNTVSQFQWEEFKNMRILCKYFLNIKYIQHTSFRKSLKRCHSPLNAWLVLNEDKYRRL